MSRRRERVEQGTCTLVIQRWSGRKRAAKELEGQMTRRGRVI